MNNVVLDKSFRLALECVALYQWLMEEQKEFVLSKQMMRSGTSVGANVTEAQDAQSRNDFISKMSIALKEARETQYWLRLIEESGYVIKSQRINMRNGGVFQVEHLINQNKEVIALLSSIIITSKETR